MPNEHWREYRYRKLFGLTHEQFMQEPATTVDWLLRIDHVVVQVENEEAAPRSGAPDADGVVTRPL